LLGHQPVEHYAVTSLGYPAAAAEDSRLTGVVRSVERFDLLEGSVLTARS